MKLKNNQLKKTGAGIRHQFEKLFGWTTESKKSFENGKPYLRDDDGILALHLDLLSVQSEMCIEMPDKLVLSYTRAMMSFLLIEPAPKNIAMIGLGGGSLAKYCYRHLPQTEMTVVEINPDVIALRNEFAIPPDDARFAVLLGDGAEFVAETGKQFDVLMVDGFDAGGLPAQLSSQQFYDDCFASLSDHGIMVVNLWGSNAHYKDCLARIHNSFADCVAVVGGEDSLNNIVLAMKSAESLPSASTVRHRANLLCLSHPLNFQAKANKLIAALPNRAS